MSSVVKSTPKPDLQKISNCLISVSDKRGIVELATYLTSKNIEIISTGGTYKLLCDNKIPAIEISNFTHFPEIMDGRVKTLHPKIHGGLLGVLSNPDHQKQALENDISSIDLLIVNLYPFVETVNKTNDEDEIIENIDIGGPAMVRSAAKNFAYKTVITNQGDYQNLVDELETNTGYTNFSFRKKMASKAFTNIANYDMAIASWFDKSNFFAFATLKQSLRYGENSHQMASLYSNSNSGIVNATQLQGKELSYNNLNDADAAYNLATELKNPACVIIKHANPCGVATNQNLEIAYQNALSCDPKSAFGGIVALNRKVTANLAKELSNIFYEVIIAPAFEDEALEIFANKKNLRLLVLDFKQDEGKQIKSISGGFLVQDLDCKNITKEDLKLVSNKAASNEEIMQLVFAMNICKHVKSNAITIVKDFKAIGIGAGQTSRVDSCLIACKKASSFVNSGNDSGQISGGVMASDAFFPFADNIEIAANYGIKSIIATGGSMRDQEVIEKANEKGISLYFIKTRHFKH